MCKTYSGACFVDLLTACAAGTVKVNFKILGANFNIKVCAVHFGHYFQRSKGGLAASRRVEGGDTYKSVNACFGFQKAVCIKTLYQN